MAKSRRRTSFAEIVTVLGPARFADVPDEHVGEGGHSVVNTKVIADLAGGSWHMKGRELHLRVARRLVDDAEVMVLGHCGSTWLEEVPDALRAAVWDRASRRYEGPGGRVEGPPWPREPLYNAFLFVAEEGRRLLLVDESC